MNTKYNYIEEALLKEADILIEKAKTKEKKPFMIFSNPLF